MGFYHIHTIMPKEKECIHVVGTYDLSKERQEVSNQHGHKNYLSLAEVLIDPMIEAVLTATPNDSHKELAIQALRAGKHVASEKPVTMNVAELDEVLAVAKATGNVFMVHQNRRWDPDFLITRELYKKG